MERQRASTSTVDAAAPGTFRSSLSTFWQWAAAAVLTCLVDEAILSLHSLNVAVGDDVFSKELSCKGCEELGKNVEGVPDVV